MTERKGEPLAEQLTRTDSRIPDTEIEKGGVQEITGSAREDKQKPILMLYNSLRDR